MPLLNINKPWIYVNKLKLVDLKERYTHMSKTYDEKIYDQDLAIAIVASKEDAKNKEVFNPQAHGLEIILVPGDGSCFYHATKRCLNMLGINIIDTHQQIRYLSANYQQVFPQQFEGSRREHENMEAIYEDREYVEHQDIIATASALTISIGIISADGQPPIIITPLDAIPDNYPSIFLYYNGIHYDALRIVDPAKFHEYCNAHNINYVEQPVANNHHQQEEEMIAQAAINQSTVLTEEEQLEEAINKSLADYTPKAKLEAQLLEEDALLAQALYDIELQDLEIPAVGAVDPVH